MTTIATGETTAPLIAFIKSLRLQLDRQGKLDWELLVHRWLLDSGQSGRRRGFKKSLVQHQHEPEDHALGRSRGGFGSKLHLVTDSHGLPLAVTLTPGQRQEATQLRDPAERASAIPQTWRAVLASVPARLAGDKGYSYPFDPPLVAGTSDQGADPAQVQPEKEQSCL